MTLLEFNQAIEKLFRIKLDKDTSHYQYYIYDNTTVQRNFLRHDLN